MREGIISLGGKCATPAGDGFHAAMLAVKVTDEHAMVAAVAQDKVVISSRDSNIRISPHFYNNSEDIERLLASIAKNKHLLA